MQIHDLQKINLTYNSSKNCFSMIKQKECGMNYIYIESGDLGSDSDYLMALSKIVMINCTLIL